MDESTLKALINSLEASRGSLDFWLNLSSALVVVGVVLEIVFVIREYNEELHDWRRGIIWPPGRPSRRWLVIELIGVLFVSLGVAGEFFIDVKAGALETQLRKANGDLVLLLEQKASDAESKAGDAEERAGKLEKEAAEIEESVAPRRLTAKQRELLASHLRKFAGRSLTVFTNPSDAEAAVFASEIYLALKSAKWNVDGSRGVSRGGQESMTVAPDLPATGVDVPCGPPELHDAAGKALVRELSTMGFDSHCSIATGLWGLEVLSRPEGPQGEAKLRGGYK